MANQEPFKLLQQILPQRVRTSKTEQVFNGTKCLCSIWGFKRIFLNYSQIQNMRQNDGLYVSALIDVVN